MTIEKLHQIMMLLIGTIPCTQSASQGSLLLSNIASPASFLVPTLIRGSRCLNKHLNKHNAPTSALQAAQEVIEMISGDKGKTQAYSNGEAGQSGGTAEQSQNQDTTEELDRQMDMNSK